MSEDTTITETAALDDTGGAESDAQSESEGGNPSREAAKYRTRLRETEAERDALRQRLDHFQKGEVERVAADKLADPRDLWKNGAKLEELLDEHGNLDVGKVNQRIKDTLTSSPHYAKSARQPFRGGFASGATGAETGRPPSFASAFGPKER